MTRYVAGTFRDPAAANRAINELVDLGYTQDAVSVMMSEDTRRRYFPEFAHEGFSPDQGGDNVIRGAAGGGMIGGTIGAIVGALTLTGAIGITAATGGVAAPFVAGPLAAVLAGGGAGAAAGSLMGALGGLGVGEDVPDALSRDLEAGDIVIAVEAGDLDAQRVLAILGPARSDGSAAGVPAAPPQAPSSSLAASTVRPAAPVPAPEASEVDPSVASAAVHRVDVASIPDRIPRATDIERDTAVVSS